MFKSFHFFGNYIHNTSKYLKIKINTIPKCSAKHLTLATVITAKTITVSLDIFKEYATG